VPTTAVPTEIPTTATPTEIPTETPTEVPTTPAPTEIPTETPTYQHKDIVEAPIAVVSVVENCEVATSQDAIEAAKRAWADSTGMRYDLLRTEEATCSNETDLSEVGIQRRRLARQHWPKHLIDSDAPVVQYNFILGIQ
jgi:hypothetical protein